MKRILLSVACAIFSLSLHAQITLSQSSYTSTFAGTQDTVLSSITSSTYPTLTAATNATWDMTTATSNITAAIGIIPHVQANTSVFASAQFADSGNYTFGPAGYVANVQMAITSHGILQYGEHVFRRATVLPTATTDSAIVLAQDITYSSPDTVIKFSATNNSKWATSYHYDFNFDLDYAPLLTNEPGIVRNYIMETDSVIGWGQMKVKEVNGSTSALMNVLQVQTIISVTDSFFLPNHPSLLPTLLAGFGLTQGQVTITYIQNYYQANQVTPLATVVFADSTFSTPASARTYAASGAIPTPPTSVINVNNNDNSIVVYPNPVTNREISLDVPGAQNGVWNYELIDITGKLVTTGALSLGSNQAHAQVHLPSSVVPGIYYFSIANNGNKVSVKVLNIAQ